MEAGGGTEAEDEDAESIELGRVKRFGRDGTANTTSDDETLRWFDDTVPSETHVNGSIGIGVSRKKSSSNTTNVIDN